MASALERPDDINTSGAAAGAGVGAGGGGGGGGTYLTLRRLSVWLAEPLRRLRLLAVLAGAYTRPPLFSST
jgi:gamma-tubulin complex component 3